MNGKQYKKSWKEFDELNIDQNCYGLKITVSAIKYGVKCGT